MATHLPPSNFFSPELTEDERKRLDRQLRLTGLDQSLLKRSSVLIVGVGGLGTEVAKNLAAAGVGTIYLCDMDYIEHSNLNRQILFVDAKEGEAKAVAAARFLAKINPFGRYIPLVCPLEAIPPEVYYNVDLIISGLDSARARLNLNRRCYVYKKPLLDGGTREYHGHVYLTMFGTNACLECDPLRDPVHEDLAACSLVGVPRKRIHCALKSILAFQDDHGRMPQVDDKKEILQVTKRANELLTRYFPNERSFTADEMIQLIDFHEPSIITVNAVIASIQSQEALKILHHVKGKALGSIMTDQIVYNGLTGKCYYIARVPNPKCMVCGPNAPPILKIRIKPERTVLELVSLLRSRNLNILEEYMITRIETRETILLEEHESLEKQGVHDGEVLLLSGIKGSNFPNDDAYLVPYFAK